MYYCNKCGHVIENNNYCKYCSKKSNKKSIIVIIIITFLLTGFIVFTIIKNNIQTNKRLMLLDAKKYIENAKNQYFNEELDSIINDKHDLTNYKCYTIYARNDGFYKNSGNYVGSVLVDNNNTEIWLSDGIYMITGNENNLSIIKSRLVASKNCNK